MTTYAIGDIHGNFDALKRLLAKIRFNSHRDRLWFVGDLVNRGPDSLGCLRFIRDLGDTAIVTLGNHDLALLVKAQRPNAIRDINKSVAPVLRADDGAELLAWLRHRPLIHTDQTLGWTMVHAGIPREWSIDEAHTRAKELEQALRGPNHVTVLKQLYADVPALWSNTLEGIERLRYITNALTRQRFAYPDGSLDMTHKTTLEDTPAPLAPWFALPNRRSAEQRIVFGHWSALNATAWSEHNAWCIDTGSAWGGSLSALRLNETRQLTSVPA